MEKLTLQRMIALFFFGGLSFELFAWQESTTNQPSNNTEPAKVAAANNTDSTATKTANSAGIHELPAVSSSNQIPLLDNRFRIDYAVEEITLVFSPPISFRAKRKNPVHG